MKETPKQYTKRILGYQHGLKPLAVLTSTPRKMGRLIRGVPKQKLARRPGPRRWSAAEILAHLADTELVFGFRMRLILGKSGTPIQAFDQDSWAGYSRYRLHDPRQSLEAFRVLRARNVRLLRFVPKPMHKNFGMHSERGKETITRVTEMMAGHDINHLTQLQRLLKSASSR